MKKNWTINSFIKWEYRIKNTWMLQIRTHIWGIKKVWKVVERDENDKEEEYFSFLFSWLLFWYSYHGAANDKFLCLFLIPFKHFLNYAYKRSDCEVVTLSMTYIHA